jgi:hypothetical protein
MNFYEKALFVKPTWRLTRGQAQLLFALRAMLLFAVNLGLEHEAFGVYEQMALRLPLTFLSPS